MQYLSIKEFTKSPQVALSSLSKGGKVVLTTKGKPSAFLIKTNDKNFAKLNEMLQDVEFLQNMEDMQMQSKKNGNSKMSMKEINTLIADARKSA
jgi:PHD/YefM family antitoxin component YafN of YafNO toxin-antitoxin module